MKWDHTVLGRGVWRVNVAIAILAARMDGKKRRVYRDNNGFWRIELADGKRKDDYRRTA